tara:strand:+ start:189 stop:863 length:675 start_codon:yes stop_codon:yes gene_type:complete
MQVADVEKSYLKKLLNTESPTIFDVGSFDGNDCLEFLEVFSNPKLFAFEADSRSVDVFKSHVGSKPITLVETALSNVDGEIEFYGSQSDTRKNSKHVGKAWSASSSTKKPDKHLEIFPDVQFMKKTLVKSQKLDTWMSDKEIESIDLMWVDVNGGEGEFIEGAIRTLTEKVKYLYIEFSSVGDKSLYSGGLTKEGIKKKLPTFNEIGVYNFMGNFGNVLLENNL